MDLGHIQSAWWYRKVLRYPHLAAFVGANAHGPEPVHVGWGLKPSGRAAMRASLKSGHRLLLAEDAFVRSLRPGTNGAVYGLTADSKGMHYGAEGRSDLITALQMGASNGWMRQMPFSGDDPETLIDRFRQLSVSKYNWFPAEFSEETQNLPPGILVVDQNGGDTAAQLGALKNNGFDRMLQSALDESAAGPVYLRIHPDHLLRSRKIRFSKNLLDNPRIRLLSPDLPPAHCFKFCHTVFVGTSLVGMEALLHGCRVVTFGAPFYAGWGLTEDRAIEPRGRTFDLTELFDFSYLRYCHYFDPDSGEPCGLSDILDHLALQKDMFHRNHGGTLSIGFSPWKQKIAPYYFRSPTGRMEQLPSLEDLESHSTGEASRLIVWGRKQEIPQQFYGRSARVEDGFIRSKGLGASFNFPYSWVVDSTGIYFDATQASDLEQMLNRGFSPTDLEQSKLLIRLLREKRLTKYNLAATPVRLNPDDVCGRKVLLVPGQVEADASIAFGSPELKSNLALLLRVREMEPNAYIVFKAHPDLVAGARHGEVLPEGFTTACDLAVTNGNVLDWLDLCDEVHTMTSTVGFEALIRGKAVTTYGMPFYAGWGLTTDRIKCPRRARRLTLEELVRGALIHYPRYLNPKTQEFTTALKVAQLLTSSAVGDCRAWHLKALSQIKKSWVRLIRSSKFP